MPERASALQAVQIAPETTPGTPVAASKVLSSLSTFSPTVAGDIMTDRVPTGTKFPVYVIPGREWVDASFDGIQDYNELAYFFSGILKGGVAPTGPLLAKTWTWDLARAAQDAPATFTIEQGNPDRAHQMAYAFIPELTIRFGPDEAVYEGAFMARNFTDGVAMTANPTSATPRPIHPSHVSLYMDATSGAIGTTKLTRGFSAELSIGNKYAALFPVDAALNRGFAAVVEGRPTITLDLTLESDAIGMDLLSRRRAADTKFIRLEAVGAIIEATTAFRLRLDGAFKVTDMGDFGETDNVVTNTWSFLNVWDTGWGKAFQAQLVNTLTAL